MKPPALVVGARHAVPSLSFRREPEFGPATGGISMAQNAGFAGATITPVTGPMGFSLNQQRWESRAARA